MRFSFLADHFDRQTREFLNFGLNEFSSRFGGIGWLVEQTQADGINAEFFLGFVPVFFCGFQTVIADFFVELLGTIGVVLAVRSSGEGFRNEAADRNGTVLEDVVAKVGTVDDGSDGFAQVFVFRYSLLRLYWRYQR